MAAEKMLEELSKLPPFALMNDIAPQLKREQNHEKSGSEYGEDINPIARLNQIQQAGKEEVPTYTVIEERGTPQRRVVAEASANGIFCTGTGPNKKLEKRATTEVILERLGYPKSVVQPASTADALDNKARTKTSTANNKQPAPQGIRSKDQLKYLAQLHGVQVQIFGFKEDKKEWYSTLISLSSSKVYYGEGPTQEASNEEAAKKALTMLSELGWDNVMPEKK